MSEVKSRPTTTKVATHKMPTGVLGITPAPDLESVFAACVDGVYRVNLETGDANKLYEHGSYASSVVYHNESNSIISSGFDGHIKWFNVDQESVMRDVVAHDFWSWQMASSADGQKIASVTGQYLAGSEKYEPRAQSEPCLKVFDSASGDELHTLSHVPSVQAVAISPDSRFVAAANIMGEIRVWDIDSGDLVNQWTTPDFTSWGIIKSHCYIGGIFALHFTKDGQYLLAAGMGPMRDPMAGNGRQLWQKFAWMEQPARKVDETHGGQSGEGLMETLALDPTGEYFLMGGRLRGGKWNAAIFDVESGENLHAVNTGFRMTEAYFSSDGKHVVMAGCDKQSKRKSDGTFDPWGVVEIHAIEFA